MSFCSLLKRDLGWCPQGTPPGNVEKLSFRGPFRSVIPCIETGRRLWKHRCCLMFVTESQIIITPVSQAARDADPETVFVAKPGAIVIALDTIDEMVITWVRSSRYYSRLLFPFGMYPAEPANASYRADFRISIVTGTTKTIVVTPFSWELKQALKDLLGERVREVSDACAPIL